MIVCISRIDPDLIVSAIAESGTYDTAMIFLRLSIKGNHHLGMVGMRITGTVLVLYHSHTPGKRLLDKHTFI